MLAAADARADMRLLEQTGDDGAPVRYLDVFAFAQPGFLWRQNDDYAPVVDDSFTLTARLGVHAQIARWAQLKAELDTFPSPALADGYAEGNFFRWLNVRLGQFKVPYLRTYQFGTTELGFADRLVYTSLAPDRAYLSFLKERDIGVMVHGRIGSDDVESMIPALDYSLGVFLGRGPNQTRNPNHAFLYAARVQLHALGVPDGLQHEGDLARNKRPKVMLGAAVYSNCDDRGDWNRGFTTDLELRWRGLYAAGSLVWMKNGGASGLGETLGYGDACHGITGLGDFISSGWHAQVQYVLPLPERVFKTHTIELGARWDSVNPNSPCNAESGSCGVFGGNTTTPGYVAPQDYNDPDNAPTRGRLTMGVNYYPTASTLLKVTANYQLKREFEDVKLAAGVISAIKDDAFWLQVTAGL